MINKGIQVPRTPVIVFRRTLGCWVSSRGCYELSFGHDSILAWLLEYYIQAMFQTKSGRSLPRIWLSLEKMRLNVSTTCAKY
jgi:hypothetical protein